MQAESSSKGFLNVPVIISLLATVCIPIATYIFIKRRERDEKVKDREFEDSMKNLLQKISRES